jgi:hypothetical protein
MNERMYLLHIKLKDIEPEIYRRFVVPGSITLDRLHEVIQIVMGWDDYHLYEFTIGDTRYDENPEQSFAPGPLKNAGKTRLLDVIRRKGRSFRYIYDFGDNWEHTLTVEESNYPPEKCEKDLFCIEGARACPPENVGGFPGYRRFLDSISNIYDDEREQNLTWHGGGFDSEHFDREKVNFELSKYRTWSRDRHKPWHNIVW